MDVLAQCTNLVEVMCLRAKSQGDKIALRFLTNGEDETAKLSYRDLHNHAKDLAGCMQINCERTDRVLLMLPSCAEYIEVFLACLYAGMIAVPAFPFTGNRNDMRLLGVIKDCQPKLIVTNRRVLAMLESKTEPAVKEMLHQLRPLMMCVEDMRSKQAFVEQTIASSDVAFLQYTSGSIDVPKGVMVTHQNIMANEAMITEAFGFSSESIMVSWLPLFHDMGLIGGVLQPLYIGGQIVLFSPIDFLQKPLRWWQAVSKYQATVTGGPNFAYELSVRKVTELKGLDLRSLRVTYNGAEPIRSETLHQFAEKFSSVGFQREAFLPCYGMAEATLLIAAGPQPYREQNISGKALADGRIEMDASEGDRKSVVASGSTSYQQQIRIVNPATCREVGENMVGEIWIAGPNVASGYWGRSDVTLRTFSCAISGEGGGRYLRTGDLGFIAGGQIYITGRHKDLIIFGGRNVYPSDIESLVEKEVSDLRPGCIAVTGDAGSDGEKIYVVAEVSRDAEQLSEIVERIQAVIFKNFELPVHDIFLIPQGAIMKTSSGKIQRRANLKAVLGGDIAWVHRWTIGQGSLKSPPEQKIKVIQKQVPKRSNQLLGVTVKKAGPEVVQKNVFAASELEQELCRWIKEKMNLSEDVLATQSFASMGMESIDAVELAQYVSDRYKISLNEQAVYQNPSVKQFVDFCAKTLAAGPHAMQ